MGQRRNQKVIYGRYFELNTEIIYINKYVVTQSHWKGNMTPEKVSTTSSPTTTSGTGRRSQSHQERETIKTKAEESKREGGKQ